MTDPLAQCTPPAPVSRKLWESIDGVSGPARQVSRDGGRERDDRRRCGRREPAPLRAKETASLRTEGTAFVAGGGNRPRISRCRRAEPVRSDTGGRPKDAAARGTG